MKKIAIGLASLAAIYLVLWIGLGTAIGYFQPQDNGTAVVTTFDSSGAAFDTVIRPVKSEGGQIWLLSGQWFRSWYTRALENKKIELQIDGITTTYWAIAVVDEQEIADVLKIRFEGVSNTRINIGRFLFLFAPVKIIRLEPAS